MKNTIVTAGKKCATAYFEKSGIRFGNKLTQRPFLVFRETDENVALEVVDDIKDLVKYPAQTKVMAQWEGKNASDWIKFRVADLRKHIKTNPPHAHQVI